MSARIFVGTHRRRFFCRYRASRDPLRDGNVPSHKNKKNQLNEKNRTMSTEVELHENIPREHDESPPPEASNSSDNEPNDNSAMAHSSTPNYVLASFVLINAVIMGICTFLSLVLSPFTVILCFTTAHVFVAGIFLLFVPISSLLPRDTFFGGGGGALMTSGRAGDTENGMHPQHQAAYRHSFVAPNNGE